MTPSKGEMHSHDLDLIAAFAEGSVGDDTEARALVETCAECRAEYEAQRSALSFLGALPAVTPMTDIEKAGLHRDLWTALRNPPQTAKSAAPGWYRWGLAVAAGLFVVVGLAGVLGQMGADDSGGQEVVAFADSTTTAAAEGQVEEPLAPAGEDGSATTAAGDASPEAATSTTAAASETTIYSLAADQDFEEVADAARAEDLPEATTPTTVAPPAGDCLDDERLGGRELLATVELDRTYLVMVPAGVQLTKETPITFVDAATCEIVRVVE